MSQYFRAIAVDYDGTLAVDDAPPAASLEGLAALRASGLRVILVTGRILDELRGVFPEVADHVDCIVAENGAVLAVPGEHVENLAEPIPPELERALADASIPTRSGAVLLELAATDAARALEVIGDLSLDCQILRNRGSAMILPLGVTKATGLARALARFGLSAHNCVGVGDAENDHALLDACELGVASAGAIGPLKAHADLVLDSDLDELFRRILSDDLADLESRRWRLQLGWLESSVPLTIPASRINLLIAGAPGSGKSYLAGLIGERLAALGYSSCVLDLEGDHRGLAERYGVVAVGGSDEAPAPHQLPQLIRHHADSTLVVDLSNRTDDVRRSYTHEALEWLQRLRDHCGMPQWVLLEEAHLPLGVGAGETSLDFDQKGICMVSYRADEILPRDRVERKSGGHRTARSRDIEPQKLPATSGRRLP